VGARVCRTRSRPAALECRAGTEPSTPLTKWVLTKMRAIVQNAAIYSAISMT
jgi:hypothetical protein